MLHPRKTFVVSPSTNQPFVLRLSKETVGFLRTGLSNPAVSLAEPHERNYVKSHALRPAQGERILTRPFGTLH